MSQRKQRPGPLFEEIWYVGYAWSYHFVTKETNKFSAKPLTNVCWYSEDDYWGGWRTRVQSGGELEFHWKTALVINTQIHFLLHIWRLHVLVHPCYNLLPPQCDQKLIQSRCLFTDSSSLPAMHDQQWNGRWTFSFFTPTTMSLVHM